MDTDAYGHFSSGQIKHLELIQSVVTRLGNSGFVVKGWAVTLAGAFLGFAITGQNGWLALAGLLPTSLFWFLDASFLRSERAFRILFDKVLSNDVQPFLMGATSSEFLKGLDGKERARIAWSTVVRRPSLSLFYGALAVTAVTVAVLLALWGKETSAFHGH
jgi:hypothetical protein